VEKVQLTSCIPNFAMKELSRKNKIRLINLLMEKKIKWGILSTGHIFQKNLPMPLALLPGAELFSGLHPGSGNRPINLAEKYHVPRAYASLPGTG